MNASETKFCPDCQRHRACSEFTKNRRSVDGLAFYCAVCTRKRLIESRRRRLGPPKTKNRQGPADVPSGSKWCPRCEAIKPFADFPKNRSAQSGYNCYCKPCHNAASVRSRAKNGGARNYHFRRRYGITAEYADRLLAEQGGLCAICLEAPAGHVDHDHATGRVRGMLCFNCNGALGQFRDRADLMARAALYLTSGAGAVAELASFEVAVSIGEPRSVRPENEDNAYLFDFLGEAEAV